MNSTTTRPAGATLSSTRTLQQAFGGVPLEASAPPAGGVQAGLLL